MYLGPQPFLVPRTSWLVLTEPNVEASLTFHNKISFRLPSLNDKLFFEILPDYP